jgi:hypothetical protein
MQHASSASIIKYSDTEALSWQYLHQIREEVRQAKNKPYVRGCNGQQTEHLHAIQHGLRLHVALHAMGDHSCSISADILPE